MVKDNSINQHLPWQLIFSWIIGLIGAVNAVIINVFSYNQIRNSFWFTVIPATYTLSISVMSNTAFRESIVRRKIAWIFMSASSCLLLFRFTFRSITQNNDLFILMGVVIFTVLGLIVYFPKSVWSLDNTGRVICDFVLLSLSLISLFQSMIYYFFGETEPANSAAAYSIWVGIEIAGLINTIFLWYHYRQRILGLIVLAALCITLADVTGTLRQWYLGVYRTSALPDNSFNHLQTMIIMIFAYYSVDHFIEHPSYTKRIISGFEWLYRTILPVILFIICLSVTILLKSPDSWVIPVIFAVAVPQIVVSSWSGYRMVNQLAQINAALSATNARLAATQRELEEALAQVEALTLTNARQYLAREIHDGMGAHLHAAITLASALTDDEASDPATRQILQRAVTEIEQARNEMRRAITALKANTELSLEEMLAGPVYDARTYRVRMELRVQGTPRPVPIAMRHALYRVAQEAVTNIGKYAQATEASVTLDYSDPAVLVVVITDNGVGMQTPATPRPVGTGNGLANMRARVEALGGQFELPPVQRGVTLWMRLPME